MASPLILFENTILEDGTQDEATGSSAAAYPFTNAIDWRYATPYRWHSGAAEQTTLRFDTGVEDGGTADCFAMAGHNLGTEDYSVRVQYAETSGGAWSNAFTATQITSDVPFIIPFTTQTERWWRIEFTQNSGYGNPMQAGIITLGRRMDIEGGTLADLDPYGYKVVKDGVTAETGSPIGVNVKHVEKSFRFSYGSTGAGLTASGFFAPASGISFDSDFTPHLEAGKPFWFAWNTDVADTQQVYLCRENGAVGMPFYQTTLRRSLNMTFTGWAEIT